MFGFSIPNECCPFRRGKNNSCWKHGLLPTNMKHKHIRKNTVCLDERVPGHTATASSDGRKSASANDAWNCHIPLISHLIFASYFSLPFVDLISSPCPCLAWHKTNWVPFTRMEEKRLERGKVVVGRPSHLTDAQPSQPCLTRPRSQGRRGQKAKETLNQTAVQIRNVYVSHGTEMEGECRQIYQILFTTKI